MRNFGKTALALVLASGLAACGAPKDEAAPPEAAPAAEVPAAEAPAPAAATSAAAAPAAGARPVAFAQCATCHAVEPGKHGIGPSLAGVFGTKSGDIPGFAFSPAMKAANLTWDEATLDEYLTAPMKKVPGTKMAFAGIADPAKRAEVVAYVKSLK